jgi:hypothetical protein
VALTESGTARFQPQRKKIEERLMRLYSDRITYISMAELLQEAAARTGFSTSEMEALLDSELTVPQLVDYIDAVVGQRMN